MPLSLGARALKVYVLVERIVIIALLLALIAVVLLSTWTFVTSLAGRIVDRMAGGVAFDEVWMAHLHERMSFLREVFSGFLLLLIGIELMQTIVMYLKSHVLHVEVVLTVAIVAIARHTIDLDMQEASPLLLIGIGFLLLALSLGYYFFRRATTEGAGGHPGHDG